TAQPSQTFSDTVSVTSATGATSGVSACTTPTSVCSANASVTVVPISLTCNLTLNAANALAGNGTASLVLAANTANDLVTVTVTLNNPSAVDLSAVVNIPGLVACTPGGSANPPVVTVPHGSSATATGCVLASCPGGLNLSVTAVGTAEATGTITCVLNAQGQALTPPTRPPTAPRPCGAEIKISQGGGCPPPRRAWGPNAP